jgi:hypothetical protein
MTYDDWKLMCPDDERECDCCGKRNRTLTQCWTTCGLETWACPACRGEDEEDYE